MAQKYLFRLPFSGRAQVSSPFGMRNIFGKDEFHYGVDYTLLDSQEILACGDGKVVFVGWSDTAGNWAVISHDIDMNSLYMHMKEPAFVKVGQKVNAGDAIGIQGSTGRSTGPHLHFQFRNRLWQNSGGNSKHLDPATILNHDATKGITINGGKGRTMNSYTPEGQTTTTSQTLIQDIVSSGSIGPMAKEGFSVSLEEKKIQERMTKLFSTAPQVVKDHAKVIKSIIEETKKPGIFY